MLYITGDIHGDLMRFLPTLTEQDYVLVCGDFGIPWGRMGAQNGRLLQGQPISYKDGKKLKQLAKLKATFLFVDGNHENFDLLESFEEREWHGGRVHVIQENVLHLMRGEVFTLGSINFLAFGGARSVDKYWREPHLSWWEQETATEQDYQNAIKNLTRVHNKVDYVFSHTAPGHFLMPYTNELGFNPLASPDFTMTILSQLYRRLEWKCWYFGHFHINKVDKKRRARWLYDDMDKLDIGV